MDDFMERLLQEVSQDMNENGGGSTELPIKQSEIKMIPLGEQEMKGNVPVSRYQPEEFAPEVSRPVSDNKPKNNASHVSFEDVSYLPDADTDTEQRPLPGAEALARESLKAELLEKKAEKAEPVRDSMDMNALMDSLRDVIREEMEKHSDDTKEAVDKAAGDIRGTLESSRSHDSVYAPVIFLLIVNICLELVLILHIIFRVI